MKNLIIVIVLGGLVVMFVLVFVDLLIQMLVDVFQVGKIFGQIGKDFVVGKVNIIMGSQNFLNFMINVLQLGNFVNGYGNLGVVGNLKLVVCQNSVLFDVMIQQECDVVNFLVKNFSIWLKFIIDKKNDLLLIGLVNIIKNFGLMFGFSNQQCYVEMVIMLVIYIMESCEQFVVMQSFICQKMLIL